MRIGKPEALDMFRKWSSESTLIRCEFGFMLFRVVLRGRIVLSADCSEVRLLADDTLSESVVLLRDIWEFDYVDNRELPEQAKIYDSVLVLTPKGQATRESRIGFVEIRDGVSEIVPGSPSP